MQHGVLIHLHLRGKGQSYACSSTTVLLLANPCLVVTDNPTALDELALLGNVTFFFRDPHPRVRNGPPGTEGRQLKHLPVACAAVLSIRVQCWGRQTQLGCAG